MNIDDMTPEELLAEIRGHGVEIHHKTGKEKLKATLQAIHDGTYEDTMPSQETEAPKEAVATEAAEKPKGKKKLTKEQRALALKRIIVTPNDPKLASYPGLIFTVGSSAVNNGRMIKKFVPFDNEDGWHVPNIIYEQIENAQMQKFKSVKMPNGEKVLQPYLAKKFNVQVLPPLTEEELAALAAAQKARGDA